MLQRWWGRQKGVLTLCLRQAGCDPWRKAPGATIIGVCASTKQASWDRAWTEKTQGLNNSVLELTLGALLGGLLTGPSTAVGKTSRRRSTFFWGLDVLTWDCRCKVMSKTTKQRSEQQCHWRQALSTRIKVRRFVDQCRSNLPRPKLCESRICFQSPCG
jgi:hypothetical protein